ncbi:MAG: protein phosphatase 2C domain-containing protein [Actinomycetota bacterium]|nr:protein phosphatase 2C domain-containing protein [Actinomycetota bacterium]
MRVQVGAHSDRGQVRVENQDSFLVLDRAFVVADGMGGANGGATASKMAVEVFEEALGQGTSHFEVEKALREANSAIFRLSQTDSSLKGMGTTFVGVVMDDEKENQITLINVGDSRAYILRGTEFTQLTLDHSWAEEMIRAGKVKESDPASIASRHVLTRVVGVAPEVDPDMWSIVVEAGDRLVLCSDGVTNELADPEIATILTHGESAQSVAHALVSGAVAAGGLDNATAVVIFVDGEKKQGDLKVVSSPIPVVRVSPEIHELRTFGTLARKDHLGPMLGAIPTPISNSYFRSLATFFRIFIFLVMFGLIVGLGVFGIKTYANGEYFVGLSSTNHVVVYQGRPGGILWFKPKVVSTESIVTSSLSSAIVLKLQNGVVEPSFAAANQYVNNLKNLQASFAAGGGG